MNTQSPVVAYTLQLEYDHTYWYRYKKWSMHGSVCVCSMHEMHPYAHGTACIPQLLVCRNSTDNLRLPHLLVNTKSTASVVFR